MLMFFIYDNYKYQLMVIKYASATVSVIPEGCIVQHVWAEGTRQTNICPMCKGLRTTINVPTILLWYTRHTSIGIDSKDPAAWGVEACWRLLINLVQLVLNLAAVWLTTQASSNCTTIDYQWSMIIYTSHDQLSVL